MKTSEIRSFRRTLRQFERITSAHLKGCCAGVTLAQCLVILEVEEARSVSVGNLASRLRLDDSTLSRTIEGLVQRDLVDRSRDGEDRRVVQVRLTPAGESICEAIHRQNDEIYRAVFRRIPSSGRREVVRNFEVLVRAFLESEAEASDADCSDEP